MALLIERVAISSIKKDPKNARAHSSRNLEAIKNSLKEFGQQKPIVVDRDGNVVAGNGTLDAALALGWTEIDVTRTELRGTRARAFALADNRTAELAAWNDEVLAEALSEIQKDESLDSICTGFDAKEIEAAVSKIAGDGSGDGFGGNTSSLSDDFLVPPFSVLDARQGYWQDRKRSWISIGISSELGREGNQLKYSDACNCGGYSKLDEYKLKKTYGTEGNISGAQTGTSIFDPVLCELIYLWFSPIGGRVLDPFAGGSVRGIVAAKLGRSYIGIDLRREQVEENDLQWVGVNSQEDFTGKVRVSAAMARLPFHGCDPEYIANTCKASCCQSSTSPTGTLITVNPKEQKTIEELGGIIIDGLLQPRSGEKRCPFKEKNDLCRLHDSGKKPFGCIASPFTLNKNGTLIVRNRYKLLKCYDNGSKIPAYRAFKSSLELIFGSNEANRIIKHFDDGCGDIEVSISKENYDILIENDLIKHGGIAKKIDVDPIDPRWIVGDSLSIDEILSGEEPFDLLFTCPPYINLEQYSDDPADISTLPPEEFFNSYEKIIAKSVELLRPDSFAVFVVGEVRGSDGGYSGLVPKTIQLFEKAGAKFYNEAILVTAVGSLPIRVRKQFEGSRKLGKTHQNVLIFVKGDPVKATDRCGPVKIPEWVESNKEEGKEDEDKPIRITLPHARNAQNMVAYHLRKGHLTRPTICESCGVESDKIEAAHEDYSKPLEIKWLCRSCHVKLDKANPKGVVVNVVKEKEEEPHG